MAIELFTEIGNHTWQNPGVDTVDVLVVAGGGGGGVTIGGGGAAGGLVYYENLSVNGSNCDLTVGAGGEGGIEYSSPREQGNPGDNSTFTHPGGTLTALGGGGGAGWNDHTSTAGGSGGGASGDNPASSGNQPGTNTNANIDAGYAGGAGDGSTDPRVGGGGGGAGEAGEDGISQTRSGDGGVGVDMSTEFGTQFGENGYFAGGGGGGGDSGKSGRERVAYGGTGGGGDGAHERDVDPYGKDAMPHTGGGGGAGSYIGGSEKKFGGDGGSGVVIIKYDESAVDSGYVELTWSDGSSGEIGSKIYRGTSSGSLTQIDTVGADQTTYLDFSAVAGETYYYAVSHYSSHDESTQTAEVEITTSPNAPGSLSVTQPNDSEVTVTWNDNSTTEDGFYVYRGTQSGSLTQIGSVGAGVTQFTDTNFLDGEEHFYSTTAYDGTVESNFSNEDAIITSLPSPTNFSIDGIEADTYILSWNPNANNGTIEVLISANGGTSYVTDASLANTASSRTTSSYLSKNTHHIKVQSKTEHATSDSSVLIEDLAGDVSRYSDGAVETTSSGETFTEK